MLRIIALLVGFVIIAGQGLLANQLLAGRVVADQQCAIGSQDSARLIIMFKTLQDRQSPQNLNYVAGLVGQQQLQIIRAFQERGLIVCVAAPSQKQLDATIASLQQLHTIEYVEVDQLMRPKNNYTVGTVK